jgi:predicted small secreted protein
MKKRILVSILALMLAFTLAACGNGNSATTDGVGNNTAPPSTSGNNTATETVDPTPTPTPSKEKTFGDLIEFDDLEIVFGNEIEWTAVSNQFSDKDGMDVFLVPITIKNTKGETHGLNMFYYTLYGSHGTKLDGVGSFFDNDVDSAGNMRSGATVQAVMAFFYDGDGDYFVEFSQLFGDAIEVRLPITR